MSAADQPRVLEGIREVGFPPPSASSGRDKLQKQKHKLQSVNSKSCQPLFALPHCPLQGFIQDGFRAGVFLGIDFALEAVGFELKHFFLQRVQQ